MSNEEVVEMKIAGWLTAMAFVIVGILLLYLAGTGMNQGAMMNMTPVMPITMIFTMLMLALFVITLVVGLVAGGMSLVRSREVTCQKCHSRIKSNWNACPYCGDPLENRKII